MFDVVVVVVVAAAVVVVVVVVSQCIRNIVQYCVAFSINLCYNSCYY